jgi:hypothetical protein
VSIIGDGGDISLGDLVAAFRLEFRDGMVHLDQLRLSLTDFEGTASGYFTRLRQHADVETATLADRVLANLGAMAVRAGAFLAATFGVAAIAAAVKRLGDAFIDENDQMDTFLARLQQVSGSSQQARASLEWLEQFSLTTKANITDLVDAFILLKNRGIIDVQGTMEGIRAGAKAMGRSFTDAATVITSATMDAGRGLKQFGVEMKLQGANVVLDYSDQSGKLVRKIIANNDQLIVSTLGAIFSAKYQTAAGENVRTWSEMKDAIRKEWGLLLEDIGKAGVWDEAKIQLGAFGTELRKLFTDKETGQAWAKATSDALIPLVQLLGSVARTALEVPLAIAVVVDSFKFGANEIGIVWKEVTLGVQKAALGLAEALDKLPFTNMRGAIVALHASISDTYKAMWQEQAAGAAMAGELLKDAGALNAMEDAGKKAAEGLRKAGEAGTTEAKPGIDAATAAANAAAAALDRLKAKYGLTFKDEVAKSLGEFESDFNAAVAAGVPAEELVKRMGSKAKELETQAAEWHLPVTASLEDIFRAFKSGTTSVDDLAFYIRGALPAAAASAAEAVKISVTDAGVKIEQEAHGALERALAALPRLTDRASEAMGGAVSKGLETGTAQGISESQAALDRWVGEMKARGITIPVNLQLNSANLIDMLHRLGVATNVPDTSGTIFR